MERFRGTTKIQDDKRTTGYPRRWFNVDLDFFFFTANTYISELQKKKLFLKVLSLYTDTFLPSPWQSTDVGCTEISWLNV
jgi:hypothetical protein